MFYKYLNGLNICYFRRCWWTNNVLSRLWKNSRSERSLWKNHSGPTGKCFKMLLFGGWLQFCIQIEILFWNRLFYSGCNNVSLKIHKIYYYYFQFLWQTTSQFQGLCSTKSSFRICHSFGISKLCLCSFFILCYFIFP